MTTSLPKMMKAAVMYEPGGPEVLKYEDRPLPKVEEGQVLIKVKAAGLNRSVSSNFMSTGCKSNLKRWWPGNVHSPRPLPWNLLSPHPWY